MSQAKWKGGCLCGAVRYEVVPSNSENWFCHCRMCQRWSGSVVATDAIVAKSEFLVTRGTIKFYRSSATAERGFCADCGSSLVFQYIDNDKLSIQTGSLDDPEVARPTGHYGVEGHISWLPIDTTLRQLRTDE